MPLDFVILTTGRTGSSHLRHLLDSHQDIRCHGELFNPDAEDEEEFHILRSATDDPLAFLEHVRAGTPQRVAGFKLPWPSMIGCPEALAALDDPALRVVHLTRRDHLGQYLSVQIATRTGVWHTRAGVASHPPIELDPADYASWLQNIRFADAVLRALAVARPHAFIDHAELADEARLAELQEFLGVEPVPLTSALVRPAHSPSYAERIANWDAFSAAMPAP